MGIAIRGWGGALPDRVVTNAEFAERLDTDDTWIVERTGLRERRFGGTTTSLAIEASELAIKSAGVDVDSVELLVLATTSPDQTMPATAANVIDGIGSHAGAFDLNAACAGFVYALITGAGLCEVGARRVLVVGSDTMSRIVDQDDRGTAILFGDGAGAVVIDRVDGPGGLLGWHAAADGSLRHILQCELNGFTTMNGKEVFRQAVRVVVESCAIALERAEVKPEEVALFVPHQANVRIMRAACDRLGIPMENTAVNVDRTGNTSAGSIPLALAEAADAGRLRDGDRVLLCGFGAGMSWATAVVEWGHP